MENVILEEIVFDATVVQSNKHPDKGGKRTTNAAGEERSNKATLEKGGIVTLGRGGEKLRRKITPTPSTQYSIKQPEK